MDTQQPTTKRPIVVGTDGSPHTRAAVRDAAELAALDGVALHIVGAYVLADDVEHRLGRVTAPRDIVHDISGRGDAFADAHEARLMVAGRAPEVRVHVERGTLRHAVALVARRTGGAVVVAERPRRRRFARLRPAGELAGLPVIALGEGGPAAAASR